MTSTPGSVENALLILQMFETNETVRVADVARDCGIAKSTAHRLLAMLEHHRFVRQVDANRSYVAGSALLQVGLSAYSTFDLRAMAQPHLRALRNETGESCGLLILDRAEVVMIDFLPGAYAVRVVDRVGDRLPAHLTAGGKAILAEMAADEIALLYPDANLPAYTASSIRSRAELDRELESIRRDGFAVNLEESGAGIFGVAAAISDPEGIVAGSLTVALPASRVSVEALRALGPLVRATASRISRSDQT